VVTVFRDNPCTEALPLPTKIILRFPLLFVCKAAVCYAPLGQLSPSVKIHCWCAYHNLVEFMRERVANANITPKSAD
jgi:hypothetical protein